MATERLQAFPWYGGKFNHLEFLLPRLPDAERYVEPFGGSGVVLLNRDPAPVETFNDLDEEVTVFFRVLRDHRDELIDKIHYSPYSRPEYLEAIESVGDDTLDDLERARLFYVRACQVYSGLAQSATPYRWSYSVTTSRRGMANCVSKYWSKTDQLEAIAERLRRVQIECDDALEVIDRYDNPDALIYLDPPYPLGSRGEAGCGTTHATAYGNELSDDDHRELAEVLEQAEAKVAVSSYESELYNELFDGWYFTRDRERGIRTAHRTDHDTRQEVLYTNYDPTNVKKSNQQAIGDFTNVADVGSESGGGD